MIHFDLDNRYQDELVVGSAISRREGVVMSVVFHAALVVAMLFAPQLPMFQPSAEELARIEELRQQAEDQRTFVFVQPRMDLPAQLPPVRGEASDQDRIAASPQSAESPTNPLPYAEGNSAQRVEASEMARARGPESPLPDNPATTAIEDTVRRLPESESGFTRPRETARVAGSGALGEALKNLQRYVQKESFNNPQGGAKQPGADIQFDTMGVEFGPWIRRFVAQVKRNWFVPNAAWIMHGRVVLQFNIHKDGRITDVTVAGPSDVGAFNNAAYNAILTSSPTEPLPPEYPSDKAFFTVTFYYNEQPPGQ